MAFLEKTDIGMVSRSIESLLQPNQPRRIYLASEEGVTQPGLHTGAISCLGAFVTVLEGQAAFQIRLKHKIRTVVLNPGDLLLRLRHTWITLTPEQDYLSLGGRIEADRFRFFFSQPVPQSGSHASITRYVDIHKTPYSYRRSERQYCVEHMMEALACCKPKGPTDPLLRDITRSILHCMAEALATPAEQQGEGKAYSTFAAACSYIDEHCCQHISREDVAKALLIHQTHVSRLFKKFSKRNFNQHLVKARLDRAHALLTNPALTIAQIASLCGFQSSSYFTRLYRKEYGHTPCEWRARNC